MRSLTRPVTLPLALLCLAFATASAATDIQDLRGTEADQTLAQKRAAIAADPQAFEALRDAGIILHQSSRTAPSEAKVAEGEADLQHAHTLRPDDVATQAWLGSITTMKALFVTDPGKQTLYVKSGTRLMDDAVRKAPDDPLLRLIRGYNSMELPPFMKRTRFAVEDFERYLALCATASCPAKRVEDARTSLAAARDTVAKQQ